MYFDLLVCQETKEVLGCILRQTHPESRTDSYFELLEYDFQIQSGSGLTIFGNSI